MSDQRDHPVAYERLISYAAGELSGPDHVAVAAHVATCPVCAATIARYQAVRQTARAAVSVDLPVATVDRAKALFASRRASVIPSPVATLRRVIAHLTFDSRGGSALAGVRGAGTAYHLAFESDVGAADLQVEPAPGSDARRHIIGQIGIDEPPPDIRITLISEGGGVPAMTSTADEHGVFTIQADAGRYELHILLPKALLVVPDLDIG